MRPLYLARIEDLGRGDLVQVDCAACHHVALLTPDFLLRFACARCQPQRAAGVRALWAADRVSYRNTAETNEPAASQITTHSPSDRNNTAVIDARSDQRSGVRFPIDRTAG